MKCHFVVGQKVVCIPMAREYPDGVVPVDEPIKPEVGRVYTVREVLFGLVKDVPCIKLVEIPDHRISLHLNGEWMMGDVVYDAVGFRPLVQRRTDISIFTDMLIEQKQPVDA